MSDHENNTTESPETFVAGVLAEFDSPDRLAAAAVKMRDAGFRDWDVHSPYPIHGMERAMGLRPTRLPWLVLAAGMTGVVAALTLQIWTNAIDYPINISGKPLVSLPAFIPITFELMVLLAALAAFGGALVFNLLPQFWHPAFGSERFKRASRDAFFITVLARDPKFDATEIAELLTSAGATAVETLYDSTAGRRIPTAVGLIAAVLVALALLPPAFVALYRAMPKTEPRIHIVQDMDFQPKYKAQDASTLFADGRAMRPPVEGAVGQGELDFDAFFYRGLVDGKPAQGFPIELSLPIMERGRERFNVYCAPCHGRVGEGGVSGIISARAVKREDPQWTIPLSLHADSVVSQPNGQIFQTITAGVRTMPGYASQIPPADRWAIMAYVRALERSQHASPDDVPEDVRRNLK